MPQSPPHQAALISDLDLGHATLAFVTRLVTHPNSAAGPSRTRYNRLYAVESMSGSEDNTLPTPTPQPHKRIEWAGCTRVPGTNYCCVCSYSARDSPSLECAQAECPNSVCTDCCTDEIFCCTSTAQIGTARCIARPVLRELVADPVPAPTPQEPPQVQASAPSTDNNSDGG